VQPPPELSVVARFYDLDLEGYEDDLVMYAQLADEHPGPILELGCGTGRVACALAEGGHAVTAVDASLAMLEVARATPSEGTPVEWLEADLRSLSLDRRFSFVIAPLGTLQHLESIDDLVAAMERIAAHLEADGLAVLDVEAPGAEDFEPGPRPLVEHWTRAWEGGHVTKLVSSLAFPSAGVREVTLHFDVQAPEDGLRRYTEQFVLRTLTATELELAARLAGLDVTGVFGDYDFASYDDAASRLIMTLQHASGSA
jgi:SAM-dependent methyltransferase